MSDIVGFVASLRGVRDRELPDIVQEWQRRIGLAALTSVVLKTPVDTGRARANWQAGPTTSESPLDVLDKLGGDTVERGRAAASNQRPFQPFYIFNNVEYIGYLEEGSSEQAPQGMAALTVRELESRLLAAGLRFSP